MYSIDELPDPSLPELSALWRERCGDVPPLGNWIREWHDRWVRFHTLPDSKRYAESAAERATVLHRYNTVLDAMFGGAEVYVITARWSAGGGPPGIVQLDFGVDPHPFNAGARPWTTFRECDEDDVVSLWDLRVAEHRWRPGIVDPLL